MKSVNFKFVITPCDVEMMAIPKLSRTIGSFFELAYTLRPDLLTLSNLAITGVLSFPWYFNESNIRNQTQLAIGMNHWYFNLYFTQSNHVEQKYMEINAKTKKFYITALKKKIYFAIFFQLLEN